MFPSFWVPYRITPEKRRHKILTHESSPKHIAAQKGMFALALPQEMLSTHAIVTARSRVKEGKVTPSRTTCFV